MAFSRRRSLQALFLTLAGCWALSAQQGSLLAQSGDLLTQVQRRGVLRVSTDSNYRPQSYLNPDGSWEGFDVDVAREIARRLGVEVEFLDINFDVVAAGSWNDRWDINVGSMTVTAERQKALLFTTPYYYTPASFVVHQASTLKDIAALESKRVGVGAATTYQAYLEGDLTLEGETIQVPAPRVEIRIYDNDSLALQDLALGDGTRLDAVLTALPTAENAIREGLPLRILGEPVYYEALAVALDRSSPVPSESLQAKINEILESMHADGTLTALSERYYGIDLTKKAR